MNLLVNEPTRRPAQPLCHEPLAFASWMPSRLTRPHWSAAAVGPPCGPAGQDDLPARHTAAMLSSPAAAAAMTSGL